MFERFTDGARRVMILAQDEARSLDHSSIGTEHLLLGVVHEGGAGSALLAALGADPRDVRRRVEEVIGRGDTEPKPHLPFTPRAKKAIELSLRESMDLG